MAALVVAVILGGASVGAKTRAAGVELREVRSGEVAKANGGQLEVGQVLLEFTAEPGVANRLKVFVTPQRRLALSDPDGITAPLGDPKCQQDAPDQVSCTRGHVVGVYGTLGDGNDRLTTAKNVRVPIGPIVGSQAHDMRGAAGRDSMLGGAAVDILTGGDGGDMLLGAGLGDLLVGAGGDDVLVGGSGGDFLLGGKGPDKLRGGSGLDFLVGGAGRDSLNGGRGLDFCLDARRGNTFRHCEI